MKKYTTKKFENKTAKEIRDYVQDFYKNNLQGKTVINQEKGIKIYFNHVGRSKTAKPFMSKRKAIIVLDLFYALENANYNNWGDAKLKHKEKYNAVGFLNFKYDCEVDEIKTSFRICVLLKTDGKFQYELHENVKQYKTIDE